MMVPRKSLIFAGAALAVLGASASAQSQSGKIFARYNKPLRSVSLDLETGTLTHSPRVQNKKVATCANFLNADLGGFVGVDTGNKFCEWFDAGEGNGCGTDMMRSVLFAYCSAALAVGSGGPGGSVRLGFYEGYTVGGGAPTTAVAIVTIEGLPANTASSSIVLGGFRCYFIRINFNPVRNFQKGRLAYSWHFMDLDRTNVLAATFPFLSCVQSCSGVGPDAQGMVDLIDQYCPSGSGPPKNTFSFGTTIFGSYFTSISMQIEKLEPNPCLVAEFGGNSGCNKDGWLGAVKVPTAGSPKPAGNPPLAACLGQNWAPQVQLQKKGAHVPPGPAPNGHGASGPISVKLFLSSPLVGGPTKNDGPCPMQTFAPYNRRVELENHPSVVQALTLIGSHNGTLGSIAPQLVPKDVAFACVNWCAYADVVGGGVRDRSQLLNGTIGIQ
jgi:hypothetical protein